MRRRHLPQDQERQQSLSRAATDKDTSDLTESGASAGMPRFLSQAAPMAAVDEEPEQVVRRMTEDPAAAVAQSEPASVPEVSGEGLETSVSAYSITLRGRTDADFSSSFRTRNVRTRSASGCENCTGADCVHVTGILESTFRVTTRVTLPRVSDFPGLTACQRQRVRDGITNVLAPHEQEHVAAFRTYTGTVRTPFDLTLCRSDFDSRMEELHDSIESGRRSSAQAASDALDPFEFEVDLDCSD